MAPPALQPWQVAAQQTWDALPAWQKALVGYGKGASDVLRGDIGQPARAIGEKLGLAPKGSAAAYAKATRNMNEGFESLKGQAPGILSDVGEISTLLPAAMATDGAVDAALPEAAGGGLLGAVRGMAPLSAGGAAMGALEPERRAANVLYGAAAPVLGGAAAKLAPRVGFPLLRALHDAGHISPGNLYDMLIGGPAAAATARAAVNKVPGIARDIGSDIAKKQVTRPLKGQLNRALFESSGQMTPQGD